MNFFQRRKKLKNTNFLDLTPVHLADFKISQSNYITVFIPKFTSKFAKKYIVPRLKNPFIKLRLDKIGSSAWLEIDGQKKVLEIANNLSQRYGDKVYPVEERLTKFLTQLYEQKLITFQEIKGE